METPRKQPCRKNEYQKVSFDFKLSIIDQINNGLISANFTSKKYNISRGTIAYWRQKLSTYKSHNKNMSKDDEIRRLKAKIEDLEGVKELQQDIIVEFERVTGQELSKKLLPESLAAEIAKKKKKLSK